LLIFSLEGKRKIHNYRPQNGEFKSGWLSPLHVLFCDWKFNADLSPFTGGPAGAGDPAAAGIGQLAAGKHHHRQVFSLPEGRRYHHPLLGEAGGKAVLVLSISSDQIFLFYKPKRGKMDSLEATEGRNGLKGLSHPFEFDQKWYCWKEQKWRRTVDGF
jgi:hypothetical protein